MQGVCSILSRLTAGGERDCEGEGVPPLVFSRDNYRSLARPRRRGDPPTHTRCMHAVQVVRAAAHGRRRCPWQADPSGLPTGGQIAGARRALVFARISQGDFVISPLPVSDSLSSPRHRPVDVVEETNLAAFVSMFYAFCVCRQEWWHRKRQERSEMKRCSASERQAERKEIGG